MEIRNISKLKFEAMVFVREPWLDLHWKEVEWFEAYNKLLAVILFNKIDEDYFVVVLARDERKMFRLHDIVKRSFATQAIARAAVFNKLEPYQNDGRQTYEDSPVKRRITDLFKPIVPLEKQHPHFRRLVEDPYYLGARNMIEQAAYSYFDNDGNFIRDFQTSELNTRLWELFLHIYFTKRGFKRDVAVKSPDFFMDYYGDKLAVEAVSVGPSPEFDEPNPKDVAQMHAYTRNYMAIKYHRTLGRKLQKQYHNLDHVKGLPLIFAVHDYHIQGIEGVLGSMVWTRQALLEYLYGYRQVCKMEGDNLVCAGPDVPFEKIVGHAWKGATAPSGFFQQEGGQYVSAVMFASNATIPTFNRMGKLAEMGSEAVKIDRTYLIYNHMLETFETKRANVDDPTYEEDWGDSVAFYHNPSALHPLDMNIFPDATHVYFDAARLGIYAHYAARYSPASLSHQRRDGKA